MRTASTLLLVVVLLGSPIFAQIDKGVELVNAKKYLEAEKILRDILADEPDNARAHLYLGRALLGQNKADDAEPELQRANELAGDSDTAYYLGMANLARKDYAAAVKNMETAIERNPDNAYAHYYAGMAYKSMNKPDKMVEHFQMFLKRAPDAPEAKKVESLLRAVR